MQKLTNRIGRNVALIYLRNNLPQFADQYQDTKLFGKALQVAGITIICLHAIRIKYSDSVVNGRIKKNLLYIKPLFELQMFSSRSEYQENTTVEKSVKEKQQLKQKTQQ